MTHSEFLSRFSDAGFECGPEQTRIEVAVEVGGGAHMNEWLVIDVVCRPDEALNIIQHRLWRISEELPGVMTVLDARIENQQDKLMIKYGGR